MPKLLDRGDGRAYYFGRRTAEKRLFMHKDEGYMNAKQWAALLL